MTYTEWYIQLKTNLLNTQLNASREANDQRNSTLNEEKLLK